MRRSRKIRAFTLVEILLCLVLSTVLLGWLPQAAHLCGLALYAAGDAHAAQERIDQVFAILRPFTELCGYGLPKEPDEFRASFGIGAYPPFNWAGPLSVTDGEPGREAANCRIVYAIPSGVRTTEATRTTASAFQVRTNSAPGNLEPHSALVPRLTKNWALFAATTPRFQPAWLTTMPVADGSGALLSLRRRGTEEMFLPRNDELFYLRAAEVRTFAYDAGADRDDFALYTNDHTGSGWQPRVIGVVDARFEPDAGGRLLRVTLLVRGDRRYDRDGTLGTPDGWPAKWAGDIPESARRYRLYAHSAAFDLKNF